MADLILTTDFTQLNNMNNALNETANTVERRVNPVLQKLQENLQFQQRVNQQLTQSNQVLARSFTLNELNQATQRMQNYEAALANSRHGMNQFGVVTQQAGYQIGDFLVQVQSGTSVFVALGQQLTQLVGVLPMMTGFMGLSTSALVGLSAGLGIAIPLITAFAGLAFNAAQNLGASSEKIKEYQGAIDSLNSSIKEINISLEGFKRGIDDENIVAAQVAIEDLKNSLFELRNTEVSGFLDAFTRAGNIVEQQALLVELEKQLEVYRQQSEEEQRLETAAKRRANEVRNAYREAKDSADQLYDRLISITQIDLGSVFTKASGPLNSLLQGASALLTRMSALAYVNSNQQGGADYLANQYAMYGQGRVAGERAARESRSLYTPFEVPAAASSGGGRREAQLRKEIELTKELTQAERDRQTIVRSIEGSLEDGFMAMVEGTKSVKDAFKQMAYEIIKELYRVLVVQRLVGGISGGIGMIFGRSTGSLGLPFGRASGGSIMPNQPYLVGEHGPELVIPRHSGTVVNANQTAGAMGGSGSITVQNNISVTGSDAAMVRAEVAKMIPQITNATKAAVIDARLRGGQMKAAFG